MKRLALVGASSQIAKDLIRSISLTAEYALLLYVRDIAGMQAWLAEASLAGRYDVLPYSAYGNLEHEAVINFVGVGDPSRAASMAGEILDLTLEFDQMILRELRKQPSRRYLFLSSGAAYGSEFSSPADEKTQATIPINGIAPSNYYSVAKLHAEVRHRACQELSFVDIRVFNYFSRHQEMNSRFFIADIVRAVMDGQVLRVSPDHMVRDYLHPQDFHRLVNCLLSSPAQNTVVDCYSRAPLGKMELLTAMKHSFGLAYEVTQQNLQIVNATGVKPNYYSLNKKAAGFGYEPKYSSLEGILIEVSALLDISRQCE